MRPPCLDATWAWDGSVVIPTMSMTSFPSFCMEPRRRPEMDEFMS